MTVLGVWRQRLGRWWERFSDYAIVLVILVALGGLAWGLYNGHIAAVNSQIAKENSEALLRYQAHDGVETRHRDAVIIAQNKRIANEAAVIAYLGGVIVYQNSEIKAALATHTSELADIASLQQEALNIEQEFAQSVAQVPSIGQALTGGQQALITELVKIEGEESAILQKVSGP